MGESEIVILIITSTLVFLFLFTGIILIMAQYKKRKTESIIETESLKQKHIQEQLEMQTQTMQHIGREIHDNVGQKLTLASLYTQQLAYENKAPQITDKIENIGNIINESLAELRQLSKSLTDDAINELDITELLQQESDKVNALQKCLVTFSSNLKNIPLPYETKSILLRIVQEFLQNSIKHAGCKNIDIALTTNQSIVQLQVTDDGKGFDPEATGRKGIGLYNMQKRTALIGGTYQLQSAAGKGTTLFITIPL